MKKLIDAYVYRIDENGTIEFLLLKRSAAKIYSGQWRMVGGKVNDLEKYWQAALREIREETALQPKKFWTVPSTNQFYEYQTDRILVIPAFAAEVDNTAKPKLDEEHEAFKWVSYDQIIDHIFWPEQRRLIQMIYSIVNSDAILPQWTIAT
jgi:dATP pyrophosphohydrolase